MCFKKQKRQPKQGERGGREEREQTPAASIGGTDRRGRHRRRQPGRVGLQLDAGAVGRDEPGLLAWATPTQ